MLTLAPQELPTQFVFKRFDGARKGRLGDVALLGRSREIQRVRQGQKVSDLLHLHEISPPQRMVYQRCRILRD
jgi:hypothetical protein